MALGALEGFLDGLACAGNADQFTQQCALGAVTQVVGQVLRVAQAASDQPVAVVVLQRSDRSPGQVIEPGALGAGRGRDLLPYLLGQMRCEGVRRSSLTRPSMVAITR